jgi:hypothetical protein
MRIHEGRLRCGQCGKSVSSHVIPLGDFYCRAWVECPECIERRPDYGDVTHEEAVAASIRAEARTFARLCRETARAHHAETVLRGLHEKLQVLSVRANTYGPDFPPTYADALWDLARVTRLYFEESSALKSGNSSPPSGEAEGEGVE